MTQIFQYLFYVKLKTSIDFFNFKSVFRSQNKIVNKTKYEIYEKLQIAK